MGRRISDIAKDLLSRGIVQQDDNAPSAETTEKCPICGGAGHLRRTGLKPGDPGFGKLVPCQCTIEKQNASLGTKRIERSGLAPYSTKTFPNFQTASDHLSQIKGLAMQYAGEIVSGAGLTQWIVIRGTYGCGKTHLAAAIANELCKAGKSVLFFPVPDLLDWLRQTFTPGQADQEYSDRFDEIRSVDLLVLDDLGSQNNTGWAQEKLYQILDYRYVRQTPTVITTNISISAIADERIRSRLMDSAIATHLVIEAPDYRQRDSGRAASSAVSVFNGLERMMQAGRTWENLNDRAEEPEERKATATSRDFAMTMVRIKQAISDNIPWILITGKVGCGKTHLAAAIAIQHKRSNPDSTVLFIKITELVDALRGAFGNGPEQRQLTKDLIAADMVVFDDMDIKQLSIDWLAARFQTICEQRYILRKPTLFVGPDDRCVPQRVFALLKSDPRVGQIIPIFSRAYTVVTLQTEKGGRHAQK